MKYLKYLQTANDFESFKNSADYILPNVSYVVETEGVSFEPYVPPPISLCDIAYWDGSKVKTVSQDKWNSSLGTPVGVVVIPEGFAPDGKARMVSLHWASSSSTSSTSSSGIAWGGYGIDTTLTNHSCVPTTDNAGSTTTGSDSYGYLPSDVFTSDLYTGAKSYVDSTAKYYSSYDTPYIPSPYLGDNPNPAYYAAISGCNNTLADFDGKGNTNVLVALGTDYVAANAARNYKVTGAEKVEWYLPAAGELGYMVVRLNKINEALKKLGVSWLYTSNYWSSSEYSLNHARYVYASSGKVSYDKKNVGYYVRPFAIID